MWVVSSGAGWGAVGSGWVEASAKVSFLKPTFQQLAIGGWGTMEKKLDEAQYFQTGPL